MRHFVQLFSLRIVTYHIVHILQVAVVGTLLLIMISDEAGWGMLFLFFNELSIICVTSES